MRGRWIPVHEKQPQPQTEPVQTETAAVTQAETEPPTTVPETEPPIWEYTVGAAGVTFTRWLDTSAAEAVIPDTLEDVPVTEIGANAFAGCTELTSVQFPESVEKLEIRLLRGAKISAASFSLTIWFKLGQRHFRIAKL